MTVKIWSNPPMLVIITLFRGSTVTYAIGMPMLLSLKSGDWSIHGKMELSFAFIGNSLCCMIIGT